MRARVPHTPAPGWKVGDFMPVLQPDVARIGRPDSQPLADRAPDSLAGGTPEPLKSELTALLGPDRVLTRVLDLVRYASDASPYRLFPKAVVLARDVGDVSKVLRHGRRAGVPVTFRSGGTSLNGQSQTDGIMIDVRRHWAGVTVEGNGERVRVRPGTVLGHVNRVLARHGRKLGPDPASSDVATVGGVVANNASGMRCGVRYDSYQTVRSLTFVLPSGTVIDTAARGADRRFAAAEPALAEGLLQLRAELLADPDLAERVRRKFQIKNTTGYRLVSLLDADTPLEIFRRLLIGSEGTLAFVSEVVFTTLPLPKQRTVSWLHFASIDDACAVVPGLVAAGATAVELMVAPSLIVASQAFPGTPARWKDLPFTSAALLVEFGGADGAQLDRDEAAVTDTLGSLPAEHGLLYPPEFTRDSEAIELAWTVREGMFGMLGKFRPPGSSLIIEDVCVPPDRIAESARDAQALLSKHGFLPGVAGHASAGNLHFMMMVDFGKPEDRARYEAFMDELVRLIVAGYDGSLKAEHGTGLNMAPFVEHEWGPKATGMMWRIKQLADPDTVLSPGVLLNTDEHVHLRNLKSNPPVEEIAMTCVECGFCEPVCPSRNVTTTPRQRIVLRREMARQPAGSPVLEALLDQYEYDAIQTCAADGSCSIACPVGIDTGKLIKGFRALEHTPRAERVAARIARRYAVVERLARTGMAFADAASRVLTDAPIKGVTGALRAGVTTDLMPLWPGKMPRPAPPTLPETPRDGAAAVYFPACVNRIFGQPHDAPKVPALPETVVTVSARAELPVWIPDDVIGNCCATPWSSKGYREGSKVMAGRIAESLWRWSNGGRLPVVIDATSCTHGIVDDVIPHLDDEQRERLSKVTVLDSVTWAHDHLLPNLTVRRKAERVAIHPTCSSRHLRVDRQLEAVARALAAEAVVPVGAGCCGAAGDRGLLLHPELTRSAVRDEAAGLDAERFDAHVSSNRTCEMGLEQVTGRRYTSFMFLLEELTR